MPDTRQKNASWKLSVNPNGTVSVEDAHLAVLMDIRDELQESVRYFREHSQLLRRISRNTAKKRKPKKK